MSSAIKSTPIQSNVIKLPEEKANFGKFHRIAEAALEPIDSKVVQSNPNYPATQRRPLKDYPLVTLNLPELCRVLETYESVGIPIDSKRKFYRIAFDMVQSKLQTMVDNNRSIAHVCCSAWLTSFVMKDLQDALIKKNILKKTDVGPEKSGRPEHRIVNGGER